MAKRVVKSKLKPCITTVKPLVKVAKVEPVKKTVKSSAASEPKVKQWAPAVAFEVKDVIPPSKDVLGKSVSKATVVITKNGQGEDLGKGKGKAKPTGRYSTMYNSSNRHGDWLSY